MPIQPCWPPIPVLRVGQAYANWVMVFGLPKPEIDTLVARRHQPEGVGDKVSRQVLHYAQLLEGIPNHLGIHAGGILIAQAPITQYTALNIPPKGFQTTHFDMYVAEDIGLHKFDILSQRGLGHIRDAVEIVRENKGKPIDIRRIEEFKEDPKIKELLAKGKAMGCFYVESPAMRQLLLKLGCQDYLTLVAASSIIRPGVARSGYDAFLYRPTQWQAFHLSTPTYGGIAIGYLWGDGLSGGCDQGGSWLCGLGPGTGGSPAAGYEWKDALKRGF